MRSILILLFVSVTWTGFSQNLHLDQSLYLSGDTIRAVAYYQSADIIPYAYHLSLFDQSGDQVIHHLLWSGAPGVALALPIPEELNTGYYTLQLTNYQNSIVTHATRVLIVNPEKRLSVDIQKPEQQIGWVRQAKGSLNVELFEAADSSQYTLQVLEDGIGAAPVTLQAGQSSSVGVRPNSALQVNLRNEKFQVFSAQELSTNKPAIQIESTLNAGVSQLSLNYDRDLDHVSLSVYDLSQNPSKSAFPILPGSYDAGCKSIPAHSRVAQGLKSWLTGFQLKGTVLDSATNQPRVNQRVVLANPADEFDLKYTKTNEQGIFGFYNLDFTQERTLYVSLEGEDNTPVQLTYLPEKGSLISAFETCRASYSENQADFEEMVRIRLLDRKVKRQYFNHRELPQRKALYAPAFIFEDADHTVLLSDYVAMSTMKEVIKEIVPYVFLRKKGIGVFSVDQKKSFPRKPLLLVNGVPVTNETVMGLDVSQVHSVQVLNKLSTLAPYGNLTLGGVVSIVMNSEFSYPETIEQVTLSGYFDSKVPQNSQKQVGMPFLPASVYWTPDLAINEQRSSTVSFPVPEYDTRLGVEVYGITASGVIIRHYEEISINNTPQ